MITNLYEKVEENGIETFKPYDINKATICGRTLEEVIQILQALDLEKEYQMKLTLENLQKWYELWKEEQYKQMNEIINKMRTGE